MVLTINREASQVQTGTAFDIPEEHAIHLYHIVEKISLRELRQVLAINYKVGSRVNILHRPDHRL
jgi:hypothetical protein